MARLILPNVFTLCYLLSTASALPYDTPRDLDRRQAYYLPNPSGVTFPTAYPTAYPTGTSIVGTATGTGTASSIPVPTSQPYWDTNPDPNFYIHKRFEGPRKAIKELEPYYAYLENRDEPTPTSFGAGVTGTSVATPTGTGVAHPTGTGVYPTGFR